MKKLQLSGRDKKIGGVCGGVAEYLGVDATIVRIVFLVLCFAGGFGVLLYLIMWIVVPKNPISS